MNLFYRCWCRSFQTVFRLAGPFAGLREPTLLSGPGTLQKLPEIIRAHGITKVLFVTNAGLSAAGLVDPFIERLGHEGIVAAVYDRTVPNPTVENVEEAFALYRSSQASALIAFGGGSPIDVAKAVGARVANPSKSIFQMEGALKVKRAIPPLYAVPTTAGSGSEATSSAVLTDTKTHTVAVLRDPVLVPTLAVLDPRLTVSLPPQITALSGISALTFAVEAYIGRANTPKTKHKAKEAVRLVFADLKRSYDDGADIGARGAMQQAAYAAGFACARVSFGNVHAIARTLAAFYPISHGLANAVILPHVLDFYGDRAAKPLAELAKAAGVAAESASWSENAKLFVAAIRALNASLGIPSALPGIIGEADLVPMMTRAFAEANPRYPVPVIMDRDDFMDIYRKIM